MSAIVALNYSLSVLEQIKINCGKHVSQLSQLDSCRSHLRLCILRILGQEGLGGRQTRDLCRQFPARKMADYVHALDDVPGSVTRPWDLKTAW